VGFYAFENEVLCTRFKPFRHCYDAATYSTVVCGVKPMRSLQAEHETCMACFRYSEDSLYSRVNSSNAVTRKFNWTFIKRGA
jgi:hypothetical protein